tara:strand:+ start:71 stop:1345 length:1275 start_codon:yes stop_codon:yes gene_type:complete
MNILIVGGGGREHALAWKCAGSSRVDKVYVAPGNAGTASEPKVTNIDIEPNAIDALIAFAREKEVGLTIVGPEAPLVLGIVDKFQSAGLRCFGPSRAAAQLEGSKDFAKSFLARHNIATATYRTFTDSIAAEAYILERGAPIVIKADGLAAGKGVVLAESVEQACHACRRMLSGESFGEAGKRVVIEDFLVGEEASFIVLADGKHILALASSQDHKARDDGDHGPNTGGMGAYSPAPIITTTMHRKIMKDIIEPTIGGLASEGIPYTGFLYAGVIIDAEGTPHVLEFNCRMGDPETQPIMMRLSSDLVSLCEAALDQTLDSTSIAWDDRTCVGVVLAAGGYPESYAKGEIIRGLDNTMADAKVFHAGTALDGGDVVTSGGRVLCVCALADTVEAAQSLAYRRTRTIQWKDMYYRSDIAHRAIER